jgi:hypothetical protein
MNSYPNTPYQDPQSFARDAGTAVASMVLGILSYVCIPGLGALAAVICGHIAMNQIDNSNGTLKGKGMATAGLVLGYIQIGLFILAIVALAILAPTIGAVYSNIESGMGY